MYLEKYAVWHHSSNLQHSASDAESEKYLESQIGTCDDAPKEPYQIRIVMNLTYQQFREEWQAFSENIAV